MYQDNVYIKKSEVCNGLGIFSKKRFKEDDIITWYHGIIIDNEKLKSNRKLKNNKYIIEYNSINKKKSLIGINDINNIKGKGMAQLANDALYFKLTNKTNNSYFVQKGRYILLKAYKKIEKHEEILVPYGIEYWLYEIKNKNNKYLYDNIFKKTILMLNYLTKLIKDYFLCDLYECKRIKDKNKLYFNLFEKKRWCINYNIWHYDEKLYISLKKSGNKINVYYNCETCNEIDFLIDKIDTTILEVL